MGTTEYEIDERTVEEILAGWPSTPQQSARKIIEKYGPPERGDAEPADLARARPWKRTIISRKDVPHQFPKPHKDVLQQFIDYRVPPERADELAAFDGSVIVERTKGELSAARNGHARHARGHIRTG